MNVLPDVECRLFPLVEIIDLKWLLAAEGIRLHVERLQGDRCYACEVIALAERSESDALRSAAGKLRRRLENPV